MLDSSQCIIKWLKKTIIALNLCPFAQRPFEANQIHIEISHSDNEKQSYLDFINELERLNNNQNITTTLLAFDQWDIDYIDFNDFVGALESSLEESKLDKTFQLVCFHPQFHFDTLPREDIANFVNRSPFALVHIIYSKDIAEALQSVEMAKNISLNNEKTLNSLSTKQLQKHFWFLSID